MPSIVQRIAFMAEAWKQAKQSNLFETGGKSAFGLLAGVMNRGDPPRRGTLELLQSYRKMPWLRAVNHRISTSIASVPWTLYVQQNGKGKAVRNVKAQRADRINRNKILRRMKQQEVLKQIESHPLLDLLDTANPAMTGRSARQITQTYLDLKGETFWVLERNAYGMPIEFWPVPPHWVIQTPSIHFPSFKVSFRGWNGDIPASEIIWIKDPDPENPYGRGTGLAEALGDELETDEYAAKHVKAWFYNRATPDIIVGLEGADKDQAEAARIRWEQKHRGFWNAFKAHFTSGKITVHQLSQTFADQQLKELRQFERDTIIQVYGISPEILGIITNSNRATIDAADYMFARWVLVPRLELLRSEMQERLVPEFDDRLILDYESPIPEDNEFKLKVMEKSPWAFKRNEWREFAEFEPDEQIGERYYVPVGLVVEEEGLEEPRKPPDNVTEEDGKSSKKGKGSKDYSEDDIESVLLSLLPESLQNELLPRFKELIEVWGIQALQDLSIDITFDLYNPRISEHLKDKEVKIKDINETTKTQLRETLIEGAEAGESIPHLAKRVSHVFSEAKGYRSTMIARTEVVGSANFASLEAYRQSGVIEKKEWLATLDGRQRDTHGAMNRQVRNINDKFSSPAGGTADHPGGFGIASEDINCRCATLPVIQEDEEPKSYTDGQLLTLWKKFDRDLIPWEKKIEAACKRGFQKQENAIIRALNALKGE